MNRTDIQERLICEMKNREESRTVPRFLGQWLSDTNAIYQDMKEEQEEPRCVGMWWIDQS